MAFDKSKLTGVSSVYPLKVSPYEQYMGDFENPSVVSKINSMIQTLLQMGRLTNQTVTQWNNVMEWIVNGGMDEIAETVTNDKVSVALEEVMRMLDVSLDNGLKELAENVSDKKIDELLESGQFETMIQTSLVEINEVVENKLEDFNLRLAETAKLIGVGITKYKHLKNGNDWTAPLQACFDEVKDTGGTVLLTYGETYEISSTVLRSTKPVTLIGYGATLVPTLPNVAMITSYGNSNKFIGFRCAIETVPAITDTFLAIKVTNDKTTRNSNYNLFQDIEMYNIYRGIHCFMDGNVSGATYRHQFNNVTMRNMSLKGWEGSFGISLDGTLNGDAGGNDSKLIGCYVKGYENNIKVINSIGTKLLFTSIDSGTNGILYDGGGHLTVIGCYMEYNTTVFKVINTPHKLNILFGTIASQTATIDGALLNNENPKFLSSEGAEHDLIESMGYFLEVLNTGVVRAQALNGVRLGEMKNNQFIDFKKIGTDNTGFDLTNMTDNFMFNMSNDKQIRFGTINTYSSFDSLGNIMSTGRVSGTLGARNRTANPISASSSIGDIFFDSTLNVFKGRDTTAWKSIQPVSSGITSIRPVTADIGFSYFDTTLGKPIWRKNSTEWVDSSGTVV